MRIKLDGWKCERCGHEWYAGGGDTPPARCAGCKSRIWHSGTESAKLNGTESGGGTRSAAKLATLRTKKPKSGTESAGGARAATMSTVAIGTESAAPVTGGSIRTATGAKMLHDTARAKYSPPPVPVWANAEAAALPPEVDTLPPVVEAKLEPVDSVAVCQHGYVYCRVCKFGYCSHWGDPRKCKGCGTA